MFTAAVTTALTTWLGTHGSVVVALRAYRLWKAWRKNAFLARVRESMKTGEITVPLADGANIDGHWHGKSDG